LTWALLSAFLVGTAGPKMTFKIHTLQPAGMGRPERARDLDGRN
jgi:hypothetical protein